MLFVCYPGCTTCKKAEAWLESRKIGVEKRNIKEANPTEAELRAWHACSGLPLKRFFNTSGLKYKELELSKRLPAMPEEEQFRLLASDGMLVKRPLLITEETVVPGFRPEAYADAVK